MRSHSRLTSVVPSPCPRYRSFTSMPTCHSASVSAEHPPAPRSRRRHTPRVRGRPGDRDFLFHLTHSEIRVRVQRFHARFVEPFKCKAHGITRALCGLPGKTCGRSTTMCSRICSARVRCTAMRKLEQPIRVLEALGIARNSFKTDANLVRRDNHAVAGRCHLENGISCE